MRKSWIVSNNKVSNNNSLFLLNFIQWAFQVTFGRSACWLKITPVYCIFFLKVYCMWIPVCARLPMALPTRSTSRALARGLINNPCVCWTGLQRSIALYCSVVFVWPWSQWFLVDGSIINPQLIHGANLTFTATPRTEREAEGEMETKGE